MTCFRPKSMFWFQADPPQRPPYGALPGVAMVLAALLGLIVQLALAAPARAGDSDRRAERADRGEGHRQAFRGSFQREILRDSGRFDRPSHMSFGRLEPRYESHRVPTATRTRDWRKPALRHDPILRQPEVRRLDAIDRYRERYVDGRRDRDSQSGFGLSIRIGGDHVDRRLACGCERVCSCRPVVHAPRGRWETRWCPPVYRTVRDRCGTLRRVCVTPGRYERVWVEFRVGHHR